MRGNSGRTTGKRSILDEFEEIEAIGTGPPSLLWCRQRSDAAMTYNMHS